MWKFKPFSQKEPSGLEGRSIDIGNLKIQVRNAIAEGGFSTVYIARDIVNSSKQYALKHMICNDAESLDLVKKEISVLKLLKGHPNVVALAASSIFDMGRTKEAILVMDYCEKSLVNVIENRGAGYFDEKQILLIFRDVCNAVFAMHCQSPPIAHRDLKAENVLLGSDGAWKLCDFGSTSTNHKCFDRPEEMGIEEDNIRKHTTPAYRAPEMWDLYRREIISEKVDIWALGCLLFRICYFKSAFDGESKLQILNGNYRIPELPKYSSSITDLIKDLLQSSPDARPDITQVWFRVNLLFPEEMQKQMPDSSTVNDQFASVNLFEEGAGRRANVVPKRSPPPPPSREQARNVSPQPGSNEKYPQSVGVTRKGGAAESVGSFWSTQHAQEAQVSIEQGPIFDEDPVTKTTSKSSQQKAEDRPRGVQKKSDYGNSLTRPDDNLTEDFEIRFDQGDNFGRSKQAQPEYSRTKVPHYENKTLFQNEAFNNFVAEFDTTKINSTSNNISSDKSEKQTLEAEVERLKEELKRVNTEKAEVTAKYEKLTAICRSQRQEIQELKQALSAATPSLTNNGSSRSQNSSTGIHASTPPREKIEGSIFELQQGMFVNVASSPNPDAKPWQAFADDPKSQTTSKGIIQPKSVRTTSGRHNRPSTGAGDTYSFSQDPFMADSSPPIASRAGTQGSTSQRFTGNVAKNTEKSTQPAGWAGF